jgi:cytosine/adenosine deaminase-related metal-dependent hydrolase
LAGPLPITFNWKKTDRKLPDMEFVTFRAEWVLPVDQPPIENGYVSVCGDRIAEVGIWSQRNQGVTASGKGPIDLGKVALIPAMVNAHTHLEFSDLRQPLGQPGIEFTAWLELLMQYRRNQLLTGLDKRSAIIGGIRESAAAGVGQLAEIASTPVSFSDYFQGAGHSADRCPIELTVFYEQLGRRGALFNQSLGAVDRFFHSGQLGHSLGISPHAPYSVHPDLLKMLIASANRYRVAVAMHLAETEAERELLENRRGPFVDFLQGLGVWERSRFFPKTSIRQLLQLLAAAPRALIIHGNYLSAREIEFVGRNRDRMGVVFCPRTHRYFQHRPYPLRQLLDAGIDVALGTDSRASNPDLNLFQDLRTVAEDFPELNPLEILKLGTWNGAVVLGKQRSLGSLATGKQARLCLMEPHGSSGRKFDWIFDPSTNCRPLSITPVPV